MLICPKCKQPLLKEAHSYVCEQQHCYDIARRGYVHLLLGHHGGSGDDKDMITSRTRFLSKGYYQPLCDAVCKVLEKQQPATLVDAGCGEGFYTNQIKQTLPHCEIYGFDLSKYGVDEACKAHNGVVYAVANVFHLPVLSKSFDALVSIFAPFDVEEILRILKPGGYFLKVGPGERHLFELKQVVYEDVYENECSLLLDERFAFVDATILEYPMHLPSQEDIHALFQMTPYYWKSPKEGSEHLLSLQELTTTAQFRIECYRKI